MEIIVALAQTGATGFLALWLSLGLRDNIVHPELNETFTAEVLSMTRMKELWPQHYEAVAHRAVTDPARQRLLFRLIVAAEALACLLLWVGVAALILSLFGGVSEETARAFALLGAFAFTSVWAAFLVAGNHFSYWFAHEWAQNTHFQMTLWGLATMVFLVTA